MRFNSMENPQISNTPMSLQHVHPCMGVFVSHSLLSDDFYYFSSLTSLALCYTYQKFTFLYV